ncbi:MAG: winged helix-turn-helix domain-containing protein [Chloroflexota bacterium]
MASQPRKTSAEEAALRRGLLHPRRLEILSCLTRKQGGTEKELADELGLPVPQVVYHLKVLEGADLVADTDSPKRGSADRFLVATQG